MVNKLKIQTKKLEKPLTKTFKIGLVCERFYKQKTPRQKEASNSGIIKDFALLNNLVYKVRSNTKKLRDT